MNDWMIQGMSVKSRFGSILLAALWVVLWASPSLVLAQESAPAAVEGDPYLDPLAFLRVDEEAGDMPLTVHHQATDETRQIEGRRLLLGSQEMYLPSATVATVLKAGRFWESGLRRLTIKIGSNDFILTGNNRLVTTGAGEALLPVPVLDHGGDLWLPMTLIETVIGPQIQERVSWDPVARRLELGSAKYNVTGLTVERLGRSTAVHIQCSTPLGYRASSPESGVIEVKIYGGEVNTSRVVWPSRRGLVTSARSRQYSDNAVVSIRVDELVGHFRTYTAGGGTEIVLVLEEEQVSAMPVPLPHGHASVNIEQGLKDMTNAIRVRTVVIDPGHGGHDAGAVGDHGILEKNVNLGVAKELQRYLRRESDLEVVLTRERDEYMELADRAEVANRSGGDLFLSLHCNSWFNDGASGFETYFLSPAKSDWAKSVEAAENSAGQEPEDVEFIVWELVQNRFISSSSQLAEVIQNGVCEDLNLNNRGVRQAGFRVLVGAYMPAVLVELGFLTHPDEENGLGDSSYQRRMARALGEAILEYGSQMGAPAPVEEDRVEPEEGTNE
jgi:N-acetylmuramoyl-L-alanine amidase